MLKNIIKKTIEEEIFNQQDSSLETNNFKTNFILFLILIVLAFNLFLIGLGLYSFINIIF